MCIPTRHRLLDVQHCTLRQSQETDCSKFPEAILEISRHQRLEADITCGKTIQSKFHEKVGIGLPLPEAHSWLNLRSGWPQAQQMQPPQTVLFPPNAMLHLRLQLYLLILQHIWTQACCVLSRLCCQRALKSVCTYVRQPKLRKIMFEQACLPILCAPEYIYRMHVEMSITGSFYPFLLHSGSYSVIYGQQLIHRQQFFCCVHIYIHDYIDITDNEKAAACELAPQEDRERVDHQACA